MFEGRVITHSGVTCPHCERRLSLAVNANDFSGKLILTCESEEGGCGEDFAVYWSASVSTIARKIAP